MLYSFRKIAEKHQLWDIHDRLLIAVSGGLDSMVLLDLCKQLYNPIAVVHCNFCLRGADADADEALVQKTCKENKLKLYCKHFDTKFYAKEQGISIEMAARDLRYDYFQALCEEYGFTRILTAHHANDNAETVLLNLTKGTGIRGLTGIPRKRDNIVRPLLAFTREDLQKYAQTKQLAYREDASNQDTIYQRNKIRHEVLPLLRELNPSVTQTLQANSERLQEVRDIYEDYIASRLQDLVDKNTLNIALLEHEKHPQSILYEWLSPYGFSATVTTDILATLSETEEKIFFAAQYRLIKSRGKLQITQRKGASKQAFKVTEEGIQTPISLTVENFNGEIQKIPTVAYFDTDKLQFPLLLRRWQEGDRIVPFGMKGSKKVSELFKDAKLSKVEKENIWILCSGKSIIWVVGLRTDERFKISPQTQKSIQITWQK